MQYHAVPYDAMQYNGIICIFGPKKGHFGQLGPRNGTPSGQTAIYRKTEVIQSYLRICGCYDLIKSGLSEPKKRDFMGVAQKNLIFGLFLGQKWALAAPQELAQQHEQHKNVVFLVSGHQKDNIFVLTPLHGGPRGGRRGPFLARKSAFFYATPI